MRRLTVIAPVLVLLALAVPLKADRLAVSLEGFEVLVTVDTIELVYAGSTDTIATDLSALPGQTDTADLGNHVWPTDEAVIHWMLGPNRKDNHAIRNPVSGIGYMLPLGGGRVTFNATGGVSEEPGARPGGAALSAEPNPFVARTRLDCELGRSGQVELEVYDATGQRVAVIARAGLEAGPHSFVWTGTDSAGNRTLPGIYFARLTAGGERTIVKLVRTD